MKMDKLLNQRVVKMKVKDLKKALMDADDESDVVLMYENIKSSTIEPIASLCRMGKCGWSDIKGLFR